MHYVNIRVQMGSVYSRTKLKIPNIPLLKALINFLIFVKLIRNKHFELKFKTPITNNNKFKMRKRMVYMRQYRENERRDVII